MKTRAELIQLLSLCQELFDAYQDVLMAVADRGYDTTETYGEVGEIIKQIEEILEEEEEVE